MPGGPVEPDWNGIRVFLAVSRAGSLVAAATTLRVSEATVGRQLRELEGSLGARLFDRLPNRLQLTPLGERLLQAATAMGEDAAGFARAAQAMAETARPPVRIAATGSVGLFLARHAATLLAAAPGCSVEIQTSRATANLAQRDAEIALRMRRFPERGDLAVRRLGRVGFAVYATAHGEEPAPPVIGVRDDPASRQGRWLDAYAGGRPVALRLGDLNLRREVLLRGLGASLLPCFLGDAEPGLRRLTGPVAELEEEVFMLVHEDLRDAAGIRELRTALVALFRAEAAALEGRAGQVAA
ncbi:MAG: LysR family transcriptional regulator [Geminicoccaceae bacterium]